MFHSLILRQSIHRRTLHIRYTSSVDYWTFALLNQILFRIMLNVIWNICTHLLLFLRFLLCSRSSFLLLIHLQGNVKQKHKLSLIWLRLSLSYSDVKERRFPHRLSTSENHSTEKRNDDAPGSTLIKAPQFWQHREQTNPKNKCIKNTVWKREKFSPLEQQKKTPHSMEIDIKTFEAAQQRCLYTQTHFTFGLMFNRA